MNPQNRRVRRPKLPHDVGDDAADVLFEERDPTQESKPVAPKPSSRAAGMIRAVAGGVLAVGVSTGIAWAARHHIRTSPRFAVTDVLVSGQKHRTGDEIATEAGLAKGQNVFSIDLDQARARLLADPWVSEATLTRRLPGTVVVRVTEREPGAIVALGSSYVAAATGQIFKRLEPGDPSDLPVITGLTADAVAEDRAGAEETIRRLLDLSSDYEHGPLGERAPIEEIHLEADGAVILVVGKDALSLRMGTAPFHRKLEQAARVVAELDRRGAKADVIMVDNDARPDRVVVRMR